MSNMIVVAALFFLMLLTPCALAFFGSRDPHNGRLRGKDFAQSPAYGRTPGRRLPALNDEQSRDIDPHPPRPAIPVQASPASRPPRATSALATRTAGALPASASAVRQSVASNTASNRLMNLAAQAEDEALTARALAAKANIAALMAASHALAARAAAATALVNETERALAEAARAAALKREAYSKAPPSVGPEKHLLPPTHPSLDFPRSHVIRRAA